MSELVHRVCPICDGCGRTSLDTHGREVSQPHGTSDGTADMPRNCSRCGGVGVVLAYPDGAFPMTPPLAVKEGWKRGHVFEFEGGGLTIHLEGYGDANGSGHFTFNNDDLVWEDAGDSASSFVTVKIQNSELLALRDHLNKMFPLTPQITQAKLEGLWREVDALGGTARTEFDVGYCQGVQQALLKLEDAGFSEGHAPIVAAAPTYPTPGVPTEEEIARAICKSGQYETGQGTCAAICMEALGDARKGCVHCVRVHGRAARAILKLLTEKGEKPNG